MWRAFLILCMVFSIGIPLEGWAETVLVRSGDHAGFSRLAFKFSEPVGWKMGRTDTGYEIRLSRKGLSFDTSEVFKKISHNRVRNLRVTPTGAGIAIDLACDCHADAFEFRSGLLVVDIKDGLPEKDGPFEAAFAADETEITDQAKTVLPFEAPRNAEPIPAAGIHPVEIDQKAAESAPPVAQDVARNSERPPGSLQVPLLVERKSEDALLPMKLGRSEPDGRVAAMQSDVVRELARAASQGLLDVDSQQQLRTQEEPDPFPKDPPLAQAEESEMQTPEEHIRLRAQTSIDRDSGSVSEQPAALTGIGDECLDSSVFNIADWGDESSPFHQISAQRRQLMGEFDKTNQAAAEGLVKAYIYAGFGLEARTVIQQFGKDIPNHDVLRAMAEIVDDGWAFERERLEGQSDCETAAALWSVLALPDFPRGLMINRAAVTRNFSALPLHLRRRLGPILAERFLAIGDKETAAEIKNAITRAEGKADAALEMLNAHMDEEEGQRSAAIQSYEKIYRQDGPEAAKALIELLRAKLEENEEIGPDLIASAEAQAFERQGTETGDQLYMLSVLALSKSGRPFQALNRLRNIQKTHPESGIDLQELWSAVLSDVTDTADDREFLQFVYGVSNDIKGAVIDLPARRKAARRLLDLGFPAMAENILADSVAPEDRSRIIVARIALAQGQARRALDLLANMSGDEALGVRARAYESLGNLQMAAQTFDAIGDEEARRLALWRQKNWESLRKIGSGAEKKVSELALSAQENMPDQVVAAGGDGKQSLTEYQKLLAESQARRKAIEEVLTAFPSPAENGLQK